MITYEQAIDPTVREFHYEGPTYRNLRPAGSIKCERVIGPRGSIKITQYTARRNGVTQTWKTRPGEFRIPIIHGLRGYDSITHNDARHWHVASDCPLNRTDDTLVDWAIKKIIPTDTTPSERG